MNPTNTKSYPIPILQHTLSRCEKALEHRLDADELTRYHNAIETLFLSDRPFLAERVNQALMWFSKYEEDSTSPSNWTEEIFRKLLLSARHPIANSILICLTLTVPIPSQLSSSVDELNPQLWAATSMIYASAVLAGSEWVGPSSTLTKHQQLLAHQFQELLATIQEPGAEMDELKTTPRELVRHALVWVKGSPWKVPLKDADGHILGIYDLYSILESLVAGEKSVRPTTEGPSLAALSWRLSRKDWAEICSQLKALPVNMKSIEDLRTALVTVALEDYPSTQFNSSAELLSDVRSGTTSPNRYADQTLGFVVYENGSVGAVVNHTPGDCGALVEISAILLSILRRCSSQTHPPSKPLEAPKKIHVLLPPDAPKLSNTPSCYVDTIPRQTKVINLLLLATRQHSDRVATGKIIDVVLNLTFQYALYRTRGFLEVMFQPVWQRNFYHGRAEPMFPVTRESKAFIEHLLDPSSSALPRSELFANAFLRRRELIREAVMATGTHWLKDLHLSQMIQDASESVEPESVEAKCLDVVGEAWDNLGGSGTAVTFTGFTLSEDDVEIQAGLSNIFLPNHLVVFYLFKPSTGIATVTISTSGPFQTYLPGLTSAMEEGFQVISDIAYDYVTSQKR